MCLFLLFSRLSLSFLISFSTSFTFTDFSLFSFLSFFFPPRFSTSPLFFLHNSVLRARFLPFLPLFSLFFSSTFSLGHPRVPFFFFTYFSFSYLQFSFSPSLFSAWLIVRFPSTLFLFLSRSSRLRSTNAPSLFHRCTRLGRTRHGYTRTRVPGTCVASPRRSSRFSVFVPPPPAFLRPFLVFLSRPLLFLLPLLHRYFLSSIYPPFFPQPIPAHVR